MKVSIIVPSHRPHKTRRLLRSLQDVQMLNFDVWLLNQSPLNADVFLEMRRSFQHIDIHNAEFPPVDKATPIPIVRWRAMAMAQSDADVFLMLDDDHQFVPKSARWPSSQRYYAECVRYMETYPEVGSIMTSGFFGGAAWKDKFVRNPDNGCVALQTGLFIRNIPNLITGDELWLVGLLDESLYIYKAIEMGYTHVKRFYCPTKKDPSKRIGCGLPTYDKAVIQDNIGGYIQKRYNDPNWHHESKKYPRGLKRNV